MRIWLVFKLLCGLAVLAVMAFTGLLAYHIVVSPLDGVLGRQFSKIVPNSVHSIGSPSDAALAEMLDSDELPDIDLGDKAFQKAHEMLALGRIPEAREKLTSIINLYPSSVSATLSRRIITEMNLDEVLSASHMQGKEEYKVKPGDSYLAIANKFHCTLDTIVYLNGMLAMPILHPGDELVVMPLDFRLLIDTRRKAVSLWREGSFVAEYPALVFAVSTPDQAKGTTVQVKSAEAKGQAVSPLSKEYREANKVLTIARPTLRICGWDGKSEKPPGAILLRPEDMEELNLLTRSGNEVEIR